MVDVLLAIASVISALAAVGAVWFAYQTVLETRALKREERLARLPELVSEVALAVRNPSHDTASAGDVAISQLRLKAGIAASGEALPCCEALCGVDYPADFADRVEAVADALAEIVDVLRARP